MTSLLLASLVWAFSFGLIKHRLAGCDPAWVAAVRLGLAALLFAPWLPRRGGVAGTAAAAGAGWSAARERVVLLLLGALQFGLMYVLYIASYRWLPAWGVALLTVTTPLLVALADDAAARRFRPRPWLAALVAVAGGAVVLLRELPPAAAWPGILLLQGANLCFAAGQVLYARRRRALRAAGAAGPDAGDLAWMYAGACVLAALAALARAGGGAGPAGFTGDQWLALLYLGLLPTGVGFWLWNRGAARVPTGVLAAANNLKTPLAVLLAWTVFGERADPARLLVSLALVTGAAAWAGQTEGRPAPDKPF